MNVSYSKKHRCTFRKKKKTKENLILTKPRSRTEIAEYDSCVHNNW